jgi:hypothetical protein
MFAIVAIIHVNSASMVQAVDVQFVKSLIIDNSVFLLIIIVIYNLNKKIFLK